MSSEDSEFTKRSEATRRSQHSHSKCIYVYMHGVTLLDDGIDTSSRKVFFGRRCALQDRDENCGIEFTKSHSQVP